MCRKLFFICLFLSCSALVAQIKVQSFDSRDGLCQSHVFCVEQDKLGYLWFGTYDGASRWDGNNFTSFHTHDGLMSPGVFCITAAPDNGLYFGTMDGVSVFRNGRFSTLPIGVNSEGIMVQSLLLANDRSLYIGTATRGLCCIKNDSVTWITTEKGLPSNRIRCLHQTRDGNILVSTSAGIVILSENPQPFPCPQNIDVTCIYEDDRGSLYLGTQNNGVYIQNLQNQWTQLDKQDGLGDNRISDICPRQDGVIFIATFGGGISVLRDNQIESITEKNGLASNSVFDILAGRDGSMYFGTHGGISVYKRSQIEVFDEDTGLSKNYVVAVHADCTGTLYVGTFNGGLNIYKEGKWQYLTVKDGLLNNSVFHIHEYNKKIFLCTYRGLCVYQNGRITPVYYGTSRLTDMVWSVAHDEKGILYFGTSNGVLMMQEKKIIPIAGIEGQVNAILPLPQNTVYFGTENGLRIFQNGRQLYQSTPVDSIEINVLFRASNGLIYAGSDDGVYIQNGTDWRSKGFEDGLTHDRIDGICEDLNGYIYLTTLRGITILHPDGRLRTLRNSDGLASEECSPSACCRDQDGHLWFGTIRGLTRYNPAAEQSVTLPPLMHIKSMQVFQKNIDLYKKRAGIKLFYDQNFCKFEYLGVYLPASHKVRYQVRLLGLESDWVNTEQTFMQYANLNDDCYTFQVRAANDWGVWSQPQEIGFYIEPPFWERWWFILGAVLLGGGLAVHLVSIRVKSLLAVERLRAKIAADLHDNIGAGLTEISILSEVTTRHLGKNKTAESIFCLEKISETARRLVDSMSDIVWLVNPKRDSLHDLMVRLKDSYNEFFASRGISFRINNLTVLQQIHLPMEYRHNLYLLFKEALHNSVKHSQCTEIVLDADFRNKNLRVTLVDNGCGLVETKPSGHGLESMKRRSKIIGGRLIIKNAAQGGTRVEFSGKIK
ncbi:hypothetical protein JW935_20800 [candidate division KSB1 bacterium]|nr:hypothetical protein [candidate division KSB1 bacterium]